ncbi:UNVERIFIED_CONTAM: hypothetical protein Sradi_6218600 [Sesamum radiatum]|uniref:Uncharacterized protein n=1 Tax=Sesamum radiatum TaxID=300843 RepID=A0AAW2KCP2_SESRA
MRKTRWVKRRMRHMREMKETREMRVVMRMKKWTWRKKSRKGPPPEKRKGRPPGLRWTGGPVLEEFGCR